MSRYAHLHVYKSYRKLSNELFFRISKFSKDYKFSIGDSIRQEMIDFFKNMIRSNSTVGLDRLSHLMELNLNIHTVSMLLSTAKDRNLIAENVYTDLSILIEDVSKQSGAWLSKTKKDLKIEE